jgi:CNT family concentrative nucleoside transporter
MIAAFLPSTEGLFYRGASFLGIFGLLGLCWLLSTDRKAIQWRPVIWGVVLQIIFGLLLLAPGVQDYAFTVIDSAVHRALSFAEGGATFVFQSVEPHGMVGPDGQVMSTSAGSPEVFVGRVSPPVKTFAFWILPSIIFFSSLTAVLYHIGLMQFLVGGLAWVMQRTMGCSGAESLSAAANIFLGQTEAPLMVKPYLERMTLSELHCVMVGGFATVAGGVMAAYVGFLQNIPGIAGHLVTASILSAPAAIAVSKVVVPETGQPETRASLREVVAAAKPIDRNVLEAASRGALEGVQLVLNVGGMLIAFVALLQMGDWMLAQLPGGLSLASILGVAFTPIALLMGVPWEEAAPVGRLLGEKIVLTEFVAYIHLGEMVNSSTPVLSERSALICSYALCGFANFASIGIQIGGIGGMAPGRRGDLSSLGLRAMLAGSIAAFMTGNIVGLLHG